MANSPRRMGDLRPDGLLIHSLVRLLDQFQVYRLVAIPRRRPTVPFGSFLSATRPSRKVNLTDSREFQALLECTKISLICNGGKVRSSRPFSKDSPSRPQPIMSIQS